VDKLVWIDCEMTGLDLSSDLLLEVACLVTDDDLNVVDEGIDLVIGATAEELSRMVPFVRDMHAVSGLTEACLTSTLTLDDARTQVLDYIRGHVPEAGKSPLCGSSIATDRGFLARDMPELDAHLHYRMIDVSSIKELVRRWYPRTWYAKPEKKGGHRALADIRESIAELDYYRRTAFVPVPGPDTDTASRIAAEISGATPLS
jgi:oligoribonuclease